MRIAVVGAGVGGLAAALRLQAAGHSVTVFEQAAAVGGKLGRLERDGYHFDTGPSLLTMPFVLRDLFKAAGSRVEDELCLLPVEPVCRYRFADGSGFDSSADANSMEAALEGLSPGAGAEWRRFMTRAAKIWEASDAFLSHPVRSPLDLANRSQSPTDILKIAPFRTLRGLGRRYLSDPRLQMFVDRYATYAGADPRRAPATLGVIPYVELAYGAWTIRGGMSELARALVRQLEALGGELRTGTAVERILVSGGAARGVEADGAFECDAVVSNADARHLYRDLLPAPGQLRRLDRADRSLSGFVLMLGLRGQTQGLAHHNLYFPPDYDAEFDDLFSSPRPVRDPALYVSISARSDPSQAPEGCENWFVLVNAPPHGPVDWDRESAAYADHLLERLAARGLEVHDRIEVRATRSPADLERETGADGGAIYGTASNGMRAAFLRPHNRSPAARSLYLVGGSAHPGGGLPLVMKSAEIVAGLVAEDAARGAP